MRLLALALAAVAVASTAAAEAPVIGGSEVPFGKWPDAAAITFDGTQACTGTLVAPTVVVTAGHCDDPTDPPPPNGVLLGTNDKLRPDIGEQHTVAAIFNYPDEDTTIDIAVIVLGHPSRVAPRKIATGWARADIKNGAAVEFVGFGTIDRDANIESRMLMEAQSSITDYNCTTKPGCNAGARPDGELGAGGMGIDTCPGDSGGPMYLLTDYGEFLAGVTSRSYDNALYYCSEGGIYGRPDKIVDWIETQTGVAIARGPEPSAMPLVATRGDADETKLVANDPKGDDHAFAVMTQPLQGVARVRDDGTVRVCTNKTASGTDSVTVLVTDRHDPTRAVAAAIPITIEEGSPPSSCDVDDFSDGGGCCDARRGTHGAVWLSAVVLLVLQRRRG